MRQFKYVIILLVVLALLGGAYYFATRQTDKQDDVTPNNNETIKILDLEKSEMVEITIENEEGRFVFKKQDEDWEFSYPEGLKADKSKISGIASAISYMTSRKVIEENATDFAQYGLDNPVVVTVKMKDGTEKSIELGDPTFTKDGYYVREKGGSKVYVIGSYDGDKFKVTLSQLRDKTLLTLDSEKVEGFYMERDGQLVFSAKKKDGTEWEIVEPLKGNANYDPIYKILDAINNTKIVNFIEDNPEDLAQYGLDNPHYVLGIESPEGKATLILGKSKVKGEEIYARLADSNEVFTITESALTMLDKPLKEIIEVFAYIVNIDTVDEMTIDIDKKRIVADINVYDDEEEKEDQFIVNGVDVTKDVEDGDSLFRKFYQGAIGVTISEIELDAQPAGEPEITFTYNLKEAPGKMVVDFVPKNDRYYYVIRNGEYAGVVVDKSEFNDEDGIRTAWNNLKEAMEKSSESE